MRIGTRNLWLAAAFCCAAGTAACDGQPPTASGPTINGAGAVADGGVFVGSGHFTTPHEGAQSGDGVLIGSGHDATTAGDTTGRGGVFVGSGH